MTGLGKQFVDRIYSRIDNEIGSSLLSPISLISQKFRLGPHASDMIAIAPEILAEFLKDKMEPRSSIALGVPQQCKLQDRKGVLLCHALSPYSESIGLFAEMGRGYRSALGLGFDTVHVMLAAIQWTEFNWVVLDLGLKDNLHSNQTWRKKLYEGLHFTYDLCTIENAPEVPNPDHLRTLASGYVGLAKAVWGKNVDARRLGNEEVKACLRTLKLLSKHETHDLFELEILKNTLLPHKKVLECVVNNLARVDFSTFLYFLLQYQHQLRYRGYIKVAINRERDFDDPFRLIDESRGNAEDAKTNGALDRDLAGIYFPDYEYGVVRDGDRKTTLTAHPYYFPSGTVYATYRNNLGAAIENTIMITDSQKDVLRKLARIDKMPKARLISDLLSFAHLLCLRVTGARKKVTGWMSRNRGKAPELIEAWDMYAGEKSTQHFSSLCKEWTQLCFTSMAARHKMPYHYFPYVWHEQITLEDEAELVFMILEIAQERFGTPGIVKSLT